MLLYSVTLYFVHLQHTVEGEYCGVLLNYMYMICDVIALNICCRS